ncbi:MAG: lamin tail domain-containing protein [Thermoplasmata archaeon]|nr:lamin tail domain-containing protein [Thermoplasmata archaeon]
MNRNLEWVVAIIICVLLFITPLLVIAVGHASQVKNGREMEYGITITKPRKGYLYLFDREIFSVGMSIIIGGITIEVEAEGEAGCIDIYIDNQIKFSDCTPPYSRVWNERVMGRYTIKAISHEGNESDEISVFIFNFVKSKPGVVINEIMADPEGDDGGKEWVELYNAGEDEKIKGWSISNANGDAIATLPAWIFPNDTYLVINFGEGINDDDFSDGNATFYVGSNQEFFDNTCDECALYTGKPSSGTIIDFVAYCYEGNYTPDTAHDYATKAGIWNAEEYFNPMENLSPYSKLPVFGEGGSIGRDSDSSDTNMPDDWSITGGKDAFEPSPGRRNLDAFGIVSKEMTAPAKTIQSKKWTVMVYMAADNKPGNSDLEGSLFSQLNDLEKVGSDGNVNIVFQIDGHELIKEAYKDGDEWKSRNKGGTFRGMLMKDDNNERMDWEETSIEGNTFVWAYTPPGESAWIGEVNTGDGNSLVEFIRWAVRNCPANHYILILNGHGAGWKGCLPDYTSRNMVAKEDDWLYMGELETALRNAKSATGVLSYSILGFDCCYMANVEVAYQVRDYASIMVASEEFAKNWDYEDIFNHLEKNPDISSDNFVGYMVDSYHSYHSGWNCHTLSAVNLFSSGFGKIYGGVRDLALRLKIGMEDWGDTKDEPFASHGNADDNCQMDVKDCLYSAEHYGDRNYIDLYHFVSLLGNNNGIYEEYKSPWSKIVDGFYGVLGAIINEKHGGGHPNSHGLSIYFPRDETKNRTFNDCDGDKTTDYPFDNPWPSRLFDGGDSLAIYAEDKTTQWGKVPYVGKLPPHPWPETPNFLWRDEGIHWDEFLHRYYKPCADAGERQSFEIDDCSKTVAVTLDGSGSSSTDDDGKIHRWIWDVDPTKNTDNGDWDRDGVDEGDDDKDIEGEKVTYNFGVGVHEVTLTVWDDHHLKNEPDCNDFPNEHWKTDQDKCVIVVTCKEDETPPEVIITSPKEGTEFDAKDIIVTGNATDDVGITQFGYTLKWKDGETSYSWAVDSLTSYEFNFDVELYDGWNEITAWARDAAENEGSDTITVYYCSQQDTTPPVTTEEVGQPSWEGGYEVTPETPIWLNASDEESGVNHIYYEIWWDSDGDGIVETKMGENTVYGESTKFNFGSYGIESEMTEIRFYATDNAENTEGMKTSQHYVRSGVEKPL